MSQASGLATVPQAAPFATVDVAALLLAQVTGHSGAARPAYITAAGEGEWVKTVSATAWEKYYYDGTSDVLLGTLNPTAHSWTSAGTVTSVAGLTGAIAAGDLKTALSLAQADISGLTTASAPTFAGVILTKGEITTDLNVLASSVTWNNAAIAFVGWKLAVTDTASAAGALLVDLLVGAASMFKVSKAGLVTAAAIALGGAAIGTHVLAGTGTASISVSINSANFKSETSGYFEAGLTSSTFAAVVVGQGRGYGFTSGSIMATVPDLFLLRDAANTHAWRNGTNAQESRVYSKYVSATDYHRIAMKSAVTTLSGVTGASVTATGLIPDGAIVLGVTTKVTTGLGVTGGTTGYQIGDGVDPDRWGAVTGTASGTSSDNRNWTASTIQAFLAANDLVITAVGGNFDGTGVIDICVQYLIGESD